MDSLERWHLDRPLLYALIALCTVSLMVLYSAAQQDPAMLIRHALRLAGGFLVLIIFAQIRPETLAKVSPFFFAMALLFLVAVPLIGVSAKGARRWLDFGPVTFQPSEVMKLALPMMLAWFFAREGIPPRPHRVILAAILTALPVLLIAKQPDLGTSVLTLAAAGAVFFLAGLRWRIIAIFAGLGAAALPILWSTMHDYQKQRVLTLLDPASDPLGAGYHTIQGMIAIGSGGIWGKGWLNSTQARLDYLPESHTDFIFAVFGEEFGLIGILLLLGLYMFIVARGFLIALLSQDTYSRLLAGSLTLIFFFYFFVNIGMVSGIMPVVGVPLPLISYGGTATLTLMASFGMLMNIHTHRKIAV